MFYTNIPILAVLFRSPFTPSIYNSSCAPNPIIKMRFSTILSGAFAALAVAAPTTEKRGVFNASSFNNLGFNSLDLGYLNVINSLDLQLLQQLSIQNNFNALAFEQVFNSQILDINSLLLIQQLQTVLQLGSLGVFNAFDLATLELQQLQLGLIANVGSFSVSSLIDPALVPQIQTIVAQGGKLTWS